MALLLEFRLRRTLKRMRDEESCTPELRKNIRIALKDQKVFNELLEPTTTLIENVYGGPLTPTGDGEDPADESTKHPLLRFLWAHRSEIAQWLAAILMRILIAEKPANEPAA